MSIEDERKKHLEEAKYASTVRCLSCQTPFRQVKGFEQMCPVCFKLERGYNLLLGDKALLFLQVEYASVGEQVAKQAKVIQRLSKKKKVEGTLSEDRIKHLIRLCHPDKHGDSQTATEMTQWLLSLRRK